MLQELCAYSINSNTIENAMQILEGHDAVKVFGDTAAAAVTVGTISNWLPDIAAIFTIVWTGMRIYEMIVKWLRAKRKPKP